MKNDVRELTTEELQSVVGGVVNPSNPAITPDWTGNGGGGVMNSGGFGTTIFDIFNKWLKGKRP